MMKKNYLKPNCMTTPMRGLRLLDASQNLNYQERAVSQFSRESDNVVDGDGAVSPRSDWDD